MIGRRKTRSHGAAVVALMTALLAPMPARGFMASPPAPSAMATRADAVVIAVPVRHWTMRRPEDGRIWTRTVIRITGVLKGRVGSGLVVTYRGGRHLGRGETSSDAPVLRLGQDVLLYLTRQGDDAVAVLNGFTGAISAQKNPARFTRETARLRELYTVPSDAGADLRDLAVDPNVTTPPGIGLDAEGLLAATDGVSSRFTGPDRGQPLPCYVDIDVREWDRQTVLQTQPTNDTPPYAFNRYLDVLTVPNPQPSSPLPANRWEMSGRDRQGDGLTFELSFATNLNGVFSLLGNSLRYEPSALFDSEGRLDPASESSYDYAYLRAEDATNASAPCLVRILSFMPDADNDGLPDDWQDTYWPSGGGGDDDADEDIDGYSTVDEGRADTDPTNDASRMVITDFGDEVLEWAARPYDLFEVLATTNLAAPFAAFGDPVLPTTTVAQVDLSGAQPIGTMFFRVRRVP